MKNNKTIYLTLLMIFTIGLLQANAQEINWANINNGKKQMVGLTVGADYSSYYGISYAHGLKNKLFPTAVGLDFNVPFGTDVLDDWYMHTGIQSEIWNQNSLTLQLKASFIVRKFNSEIASLVNLGADVSTLFGYSKPKWGIMAEANYDRSISTYINNYKLKEYYPQITNGWYNSAGGNFKFGARANASIKTVDVFLHLGKAFGQNFSDNPTLPFYLKLSISKSF